MKCHTAALEDPPSDSSNHKMWALCDLSLTIIMSKATSYNDFNKEFPFKPTIPPLHFKPHADPNFENPTTYIPPELALLPKSKIGLSAIGWQNKRVVSGGRRKSNEDEKRTEISGGAMEENGNHIEDTDLPPTRKRATRSSEGSSQETESTNGKEKDDDSAPPMKKQATTAGTASSTNEDPQSETAGGTRSKRTRR